MPKPRNPKTCVDCGGQFWPNSGIQKRCTACKEKPKKRKQAQEQQEPQSPRRRRAEEVSGHVKMRMGARLSRIEQESFERFRGSA